MYEEQTKEDREAGVKKNYVGNGKIFWTDGKISVADKVDRETTKTSSDVDLPF